MSYQSPTSVDISSSDGGSTPTDESTSDKDSIVEGAKREPSSEEPVPFTETKETDDASAGLQGKFPIYESNATEMKGHLNKAYRDLLNSVIEDAKGVTHSDSDQLLPSQIGPYFWTSQEKEAFFSALSTKGRDDLPGISHAIRTKSEVEVRSFLLHLETSCLELNSPSPSATGSSPSDSSAAYEIREYCDHALELTAEVLNQHVLRNEVVSEKKKFGDSWLINEECAAQIELLREQAELSAAVDLVDLETNVSGEAENEDTELVEKSGDGPLNIKFTGHMHSAGLLKPEAFLQLSRELFMNNGTDPGLGWLHLGSTGDISETPAMFRSVLDKFYNIAVNRTCWIVHATLFQALSRLRAKDDQNPAAHVTVDDVKAAIEFLDLGSDWEKYWSGVARRCGVEVYSDAVKFHDGRPGTKIGRLLTYDEVEEELGFPREGTDTQPVSKSGSRITEADQYETSPSDSENSTAGSKDDQPSGDEPGSETESSKSAEFMGKRKRAASFLSDEDDNDTDLNALDEQASREEERRLLGMLRYSASPAAKPKSGDAPDLDISRCWKRAKRDSQPDWRHHTEYMAEWEQRQSSPLDKAFEESEDA